MLSPEPRRRLLNFTGFFSSLLDSLAADMIAGVFVGEVGLTEAEEVRLRCLGLGV